MVIKDPEMGKVFADVELFNAGDEFIAKSSKKNTPIRQIKIQTLVDTGATMLVLAPEHIKSLGLQQTRLMKSRNADGTLRDRRIFGPVTVKVGQRTMQTEAAEGTKGIPSLLGQIPLEGLDLLVDSKNQRLILNPLSPDPEMGMIDIFEDDGREIASTPSRFKLEFKLQRVFIPKGFKPLAGGQGRRPTPPDHHPPTPPTPAGVAAR